jgi:hypothetical protein
MVRPSWRLRLLLAIVVLVATACGPSARVGAPTPSTSQPVGRIATPGSQGISFYDPSTQAVIIFGGTVPDVTSENPFATPTPGTAEAPIMWAWDGQNWTTVLIGASDPLPDEHSAGLTAYDVNHKRVLLFGGLRTTRVPTLLQKLWSWSGGRWTRLSDAPISADSNGGGMAYDAMHHELVVVTTPPSFRWGTDDSRGVLMDTWLFDGSTWHQVKSTHQLPFRPESLVFDRSSQRVLASRLSPPVTEVWSWDGHDWSLTPDPIPTIRGLLVDGGDLGLLAVEEGDPLASPGQNRPVFRLVGGHWVAAGPLTVGPTTVFAPAYDQHRKELVAFGDVLQPDPSRQVSTQDTWTWTLARGWSKHAGPTPTPSPGPAPFPSPTPCASHIPPSTFAASTPSDRTLALVKLSGSDQIVVRDITDINHPATVATLPDGRRPTFVNGAEIADYNQNGIMRMHFLGSPQAQVVNICPGGAAGWDWSLDGRSVTYLAALEDTTQARQTLRLEWHLLSGGSDRVVGKAPGWVLGIECGPGDVDDYRVAFSPDGKYLSLVENFCGGVDFQVRRIDGSLVSEINGTVGLPLAPTMGVWSGSTLYFRDAKGVEAWRDGTVTPFLPGVAWITPKASPAGGKITYAARGNDGLGHVYVVDTGTGKVVSLPNAGRVEPVFLSARYIWYAGEQLCSPPGSCMGPGTLPTGKTYIYDLQAGTETESKITAVYDVWPHGN